MWDGPWILDFWSPSGPFEATQHAASLAGLPLAMLVLFDLKLS